MENTTDKSSAHNSIEKRYIVAARCSDGVALFEFKTSKTRKDFIEHFIKNGASESDFITSEIMRCV